MDRGQPGGADEFAVSCHVAAQATIVTVRGAVPAARCRLLSDALETARMLRAEGPIVVDVGQAERISAAAVAVLRTAGRRSRKLGRPFTIRNLRADLVEDARAAALLGDA